MHLNKKRFGEQRTKEPPLTQPGEPNSKLKDIVGGGSVKYMEPSVGGSISSKKSSRDMTCTARHLLKLPKTWEPGTNWWSIYHHPSLPLRVHYNLIAPELLTH